jgi:hypothetical protein
MGDRTYVSLYVLKEHADEAKKIIKVSADGMPSDEGASSADTLYLFGFDEVNYGDLKCLPQLQAAGIAFDSSWERGSGYSPGTKSCRFTPEGECIIKEIYDGDQDPEMHELLKRINDYTQLKEYILNHREAHTVLPWDNQIEYGKIYRTLQLITP